MDSVQITAFHPNKATYRPGERVELLITLTNPLTRSLSVDLMVSIKHLTQEATLLAQPAELPPAGQQTPRLAWSPPIPSGSTRRSGSSRDKAKVLKPSA